MRIVLIGLIVFLPMLAEALRAGRNERAQLARGGFRPDGDVHEIMRIAYPAVFVAILVEGAVRGGGQQAPAVFTAGLLVFAAAKMVKWSAILALGRCWTFRVIVVPGDRRVTGGPYRLMRHPNYVGVLGEIGGAALMAGAPLTAALGLVGFGSLMYKRIRVEDRALDRLIRTK